MGISSLSSCAAQSTSNQCAYGDLLPSASTDHSCLLSDSGTGLAMWFGTTSTTTPRPYRRNTSTIERNVSSPPRSAETREWSTTS